MEDWSDFGATSYYLYLRDVTPFSRHIPHR